LDSIKDLFALVKENCKQKMPEASYDLWIKNLECTHIDCDKATIFTTSELYKSILEAKHKDLIKNSFYQVMGFDIDVEFKSKEAEQESTVENNINEEDDDEVFTFDSFVVGPSNNFAYAASVAVASGPAPDYNPLFIYGDSGLGKTHLLKAICSEISEKRPNYNIIYCKGETFTNELIEAISRKNTSPFHNKYRQADILLIDDIQFISGKEQTQEEFFHTFNALHEEGKQIVLTSDRPPKDIRTLEDRLRTRFENGIIADIKAPEYETRVAIIRRKAASLNFEISDEVIDLIANSLKNNIRQLEGTVKKLKAYNHLAGLAPSVSLTKKCIDEIVNDSQPVSVTVDRIITEVSRYYDVSPLDVRSNKRNAKFSMARQIAMYIIRERTNLPLDSIGKEFSDRNHATVVYAVDKVNEMMETNSSFKNSIEDLMKNINSK